MSLCIADMNLFIQQIIELSTNILSPTIGQPTHLNLIIFVMIWSRANSSKIINFHAYDRIHLCSMFVNKKIIEMKYFQLIQTNKLNKD